MYKRLPIIALVSILYSSFGLKAQTYISGSLESTEGWSNKIYLLAITEYKDVFSSTNSYFVDTADLDSAGHFAFTLDTLPCSTCLYRIDIRPQHIQGPMLFIGTSKENFALFELKENQSFQITGNAQKLTKSFRVKSNTPGWTYETLRRLREPVYEVGDDLQKQFSNPQYLKGKNVDSLKQAGIKRLKDAWKQNNDQLLEYMKSSSNMYDKILGSLLYDVKIENSLEIYEMMGNQLSEADSAHPYSIQFKKDIYETKYVLPRGSTAPNLIVPNAKGEQVSLKELGSNLILVDFWASWCAPCRHENRITVKPLYAKYKDKGFVVLSVSMDDNKEKWLNAVLKDEMDWINVSDLLGSQSPIYSTYKIDYLPTTYLIEKNGFKILAKNIRGDELRKFVEKYYSKAE